MAHSQFAVLILVSGFLLSDVQGHGRLVDPPSRNAMWKYGFPNKPNFNLNELNCGGSKNHWEVQGGKCGLCGDPYQGPRKHEAGYIGGYANGIIGRVYKEGQFIDVRVDITANHFGWFEFSLCPSNGAPVTQQCFNQYKLADASGNTRHRLRLTGYKGTVHFQLRLPANLVCSQCVIQWFWFAGNSRDRIPQETFVNCADVVITRRDGTLGQGLVMPEILPQAYQPIPEANHTLGQGQVIGLEGEWDCSVPPPYNGPKERVYKEWCLENCLYALPDQRSCPVETCRCHRTDRRLNPDEERQLLGITDEYPEIGNNRQGSQSPTDSTRDRGNLEGTWECRVVHPFNHDDFYEWCIVHCIEALPHERDCPNSHCECWRTDRNLGKEEESRQLQPIPQARQNTGSNTAPSNSANSNDIDWKRESQIRYQPNGLEGRWECDVVSPYNTIAKRLHYYQWCIQNCINAAPSDRFCPEDMCDCYRTDVRQSKEEIRAQLEGGVVQPPRTADSESRGIPPALESIIAYNNDIASDDGQLPALQGEWDCEVVFRIQQETGAEKKRRELHEWCLDMCIRPQPNDRYCPQTHCRCYRTDVQQSDAENRRQLQTGVSVQGIIHAESGEEGSLANDQNTPYVGGGGNQEPSEEQYTCEAVAPFHTGDQGRETLRFCYDSCVLEIASQRHCPESHCLCYETSNPNNRLQSAESARPTQRSNFSNNMRNNLQQQRQRRNRRSLYR
ncbi:uncharacterized protein [Watersipora subatra]|uniref:uncharacterized protein n=1 Tax=Watersipora subatra TaxID=2589382 RepID=UPI00355B435D